VRRLPNDKAAREDGIETEQVVEEWQC